MRLARGSRVDVELLKKIGGILGKTYKVDPITESQARGRFAMICIKIDITKPLKSTLEVVDRSITVEWKNGNGFKYANSFTTSGAERHGNVDNGSNSVSDLPTFRVEFFGLAMGNSKENIRLVGSIVKKGALAIMSGQMGSKKAGGSRFAILNEDMEEVIAAVATQSTDGSQGKVSAKKVLAEFSNRTFVSIKQPNTTANKYLVNHNTDKGTKTKPFKENVTGIGVVFL
ncbi:hypothetical protein LWI28_018702 [Acer negundo]|uniref:Uncharacterized protein n=1 Tax=Acer negundo TaxID=4023 RepID=A0AAD5IJ33_ACENE|nr:hypothetical protein LWI28_018702 [Acer negundo]